MKKIGTVVLGAGISGLAAGIKTKVPIYEAKKYVGGLCYSYQIDNCHFEYSGGHWIFGNEQRTFNFIQKLSPLGWHNKKTSVYFPQENLFVPYPIQKNISFLPVEIQEKIKQEVKTDKANITTFKDWLEFKFGAELCRLFFFPFHQQYTAGLYQEISPTEKYKNPSQKIKTYNDSFAYPQKGLNHLITQMAKKCKIKYNKNVIKIDLKIKTIFFTDQSKIKYQKIISTIPLNKMSVICGLKIKDRPSPYTSLLVVNLLAPKGPNCPTDHWLYIPQSKSGFHRVGFYSNVDKFFLPKNQQNCVSLYVEKAYLGGKKLSQEEQKKTQEKIISELIEWQFIKKPKVIDSNFIEVAYTWDWPKSSWKRKALKELKNNNIFQIGRYGRWHFQGILESLKEGLSINLV